jgi:hypothetical protein
MSDMPAEKKLVRRKPADVPVRVNIRRAVTDWANFDNLATKFAGQANEVKLLLRDTVLPAQGVTDERGHSWIMFESEPIEDPSGKGSIIGIKRERRAPKTLNSERAEQFLRRKGLWQQCTEEVTTTMINEDAILAAAFAKTITEDELQALYDVKETFAFLPQRSK